MAEPELTASSRRARLLAVATELFSRYGVRRTSIADIATAAGVAKGSVYLEFASKTQLFRGVVEALTVSFLDDATAAVSAPGPIGPRVTAILLSKFWRMYDLVHRRPHASELISAKDDAAADVLRTADDRYRDILSGALAADGFSPRPPYSLDQVVSVLLRTAAGTGYGGAGQLDAEQFADRLRLAVELILAGAAGEPDR